MSIDQLSERLDRIETDLIEHRMLVSRAVSDSIGYWRKFLALPGEARDNCAVQVLSTLALHFGELSEHARDCEEKIIKILDERNPS